MLSPLMGVLLAAITSAIIIDQYPSEIEYGHTYEIICSSYADDQEPAFLLYDARPLHSKSVAMEVLRGATRGSFMWDVTPDLALNEEWEYYIRAYQGQSTNKSGTIRFINRAASRSTPSSTVLPGPRVPGTETEKPVQTASLVPISTVSLPQTTTLRVSGMENTHSAFPSGSEGSSKVTGSHLSDTELSSSQLSSTEDSDTRSISHTDQPSDNGAQTRAASPSKASSTAVIAGISAGAGIGGLLLGIGLILLLLHILEKRRHGRNNGELRYPNIPEMEDEDQNLSLVKWFLRGKWRTESAARERRHEIDGRTVRVVPGPPVEMDASKGL